MTKILLAVTLAALIPAAGGSAFHVQGSDSTPAQVLWEKVIDAKGGRERLLAVNNMLEVQEDSYWLSLFRRGRLHFVEPFVFPNKSWTWRDHRPFVIGLVISTYNGDLNKAWFVDLPPGIVPVCMLVSSHQLIS